MLCSLSVENVLLFVMRVLSWVIIVAESSIFLMASKILCWILWWILAEFMTEFDFSERISRVHFVVNLLLVAVTMVVCSMRRL